MARAILPLKFIKGKSTPKADAWWRQCRRRGAEADWPRRMFPVSTRGNSWKNSKPSTGRAAGLSFRFDGLFMHMHEQSVAAVRRAMQGSCHPNFDVRASKFGRRGTTPG